MKWGGGNIAAGWATSLSGTMALLRPGWLDWFGRRLAGGLLVVLVLVGFRAWWAFHDRYPGYQLALAIDGRTTAPGTRLFQAGFGRIKITPVLGDPAHPVWIAGFDQGRAATGVHDDLWAIAMVLDDGQARIGVVALDAIGFFHDEVISVRRRLPSELRLDYTIVCSTHNHSTPDLLGLWGPNLWHSGVDSRYREQVINASVSALVQATQALEPVRLAEHEIVTPPAGLVTDTRLPEVYDPDIRLLHFTRPRDGTTVGTLVAWANHPETPWAKNHLLTADFPGVIRDALEYGIRYEGAVRQPGLGGIHLYVNGAVGGLMTTHPSTTVHDPYLDRDFKEPSHEKTRALGHNLAQRILDRLARPTASKDFAPISVYAHTLELPMANNNFLWAGMLGLMDRGHVRWKHIRSEVALVTIGDASIACIPGEIYPELVNGGIVRAPGGDFDTDPVEIPPLRELMPGRLKFIFGLANDEIGYIIPKSEWDEKPPYLFHATHRPYGEINSLGPETAYLLHTAIRAHCEAQAARSK